MADILITEFMDEAAVDLLRETHSVDYAPELADRQDDIPARMADVRALIVRNRTQVRDAILAAGDRLRCVGRLGVGLDNIDVAACDAAGVTVYPATGANDDAVAEYVIAAVMMLIRGAYQARARMLAGEWPRQALMGSEIGGRTLGLIGYGAIARQTARRARALGMEVIAHDPFVDAVEGVELLPLETLLNRADAVSLHVPLTEETRHLIDATALSRMKPSAVLVNAARGGVVDERALGAALTEGRLAGAALDVFEEEPLAEASHLPDLPNLILTPHIAGVTGESNVRVSRLTAQKVLAHLAK
ncbi:hydroxyacid dehydrogenase [Roseobacter sp. HKCCA0434]|uniref:hydroxyacid dehydrogenase n=1 Tax=Roseobacter sp. HKCCA0434 TaxID=3079297 RepID=UPI002905B94F|nr:hydroxyacid dehydrogenase [Roseobacter sp. HKCCA0434]